MQKKVRRYRYLVGLAAVALLASACSGGDSTGSSTAGSQPAAGGGGDLVLWTGAGPGGDATKALAEEFGKQNGVNVKVELLPGDTLQANFVTASQAGKAPDIVFGAHDWIGNLVQNGTIEPIQLPEATASQFQPLSIKAVTFNGQVYGMPYTMNNVVLIRNTALAPDAPATMEDLVAKGTALKKAGKTKEIMALPVGQTGNPYMINALYSSAGGYMFGTNADGDFDPSDLGVAKPGATAAYQKIAKLGEKGDGALKRSITSDNVVNLFTSKKTAFLIDGPWDLPLLAKSDIKYEVSAVPSFAGGKAASPFITVDAAYVASKGKNKAIAQEFVTNYWSQPAVSLAYFKATQSVPANKSVLEQIKSSDPQIYKVSEAGAKSGQIMPSIPQMAAVWDPLGKAEAAIIGGANPKSTIAAAAKAIQSQIK